LTFDFGSNIVNNINMKGNFLKIFISGFLLISCSNKGRVKLLKSPADTLHAGIPESSRTVLQVRNALSDSITGIWASVGDENASFILSRDRIYYPDKNDSFKYFLVNDSIKIEYVDFIGSYLIKVTQDTLTLVGDESQIYYRFKK
jgi:hypothetical protein